MIYKESSFCFRISKWNVWERIAELKWLLQVMGKETLLRMRLWLGHSDLTYAAFSVKQCPLAVNSDGSIVRISSSLGCYVHEWHWQEDEQSKQNDFYIIWKDHWFNDTFKYSNCDLRTLILSITYLILVANIYDFIILWTLKLLIFGPAKRSICMI